MKVIQMNCLLGLGEGKAVLEQSKQKGSQELWANGDFLLFLNFALGQAPMSQPEEKLSFLPSVPDLMQAEEGGTIPQYLHGALGDDAGMVSSNTEAHPGAEKDITNEQVIPAGTQLIVERQGEQGNRDFHLRGTVDQRNVPGQPVPAHNVRDAKLAVPEHRIFPGYNQGEQAPKTVPERETCPVVEPRVMINRLMTGENQPVSRTHLPESLDLMQEIKPESSSRVEIKPITSNKAPDIVQGEGRGEGKPHMPGEEKVGDNYLAPDHLKTLSISPGEVSLIKEQPAEFRGRVPLDQLPEKIGTFLKQETGTGQPRTLELNLEPEFLGKLTITVTWQKGQISAHFTAQNQLAAAALNQGLEMLKENLSKLHLNVTGLSVAVAGESAKEAGGVQTWGFKREKERAERGYGVAFRTGGSDRMGAGDSSVNMLI